MSLKRDLLIDAYLIQDCDLEFGFRVVAPGARRANMKATDVTAARSGDGLQECVFAAESQVCMPKEPCERALRYSKETR